MELKNILQGLVLWQVLGGLVCDSDYRCAPFTVDRLWRME